MKEELPLYQQIADYIKNKIMTLEWPVGYQIPKERELCEMFNASRMTVSKALNILVQMNMIYRTAGRGTFVRMSSPDSNIGSIFSFSEKMKKIGKTTSSKILEYSVVPAKSLENIQSVLQLNDSEYMHKIVRQRYVDQELIAIQIIFMSAKVIPMIDVRCIESSLYEYIEDKLGLKIMRNDTKLQAVNSNDFVNHAFGYEIDVPLLKSTNIGYIEGDIPFEVNETYHLSDKYEYRISNYRHQSVD